MTEEQQENIADIDFSVIRTAIEAGGSSIEQILKGLHYGSHEVRCLLLAECDLVIECKVCRALFRALPNFIAHKRVYCPKPFHEVRQPFYNDRSKDQTVTVQPTSPEDDTASTAAAPAPVHPEDMLDNLVDNLQTGAVGVSEEYQFYSNAAKMVEQRKNKQQTHVKLTKIATNPNGVMISIVDSDDENENKEITAAEKETSICVPVNDVPFVDTPETSGTEESSSKVKSVNNAKPKIPLKPSMTTKQSPLDTAICNQLSTKRAVVAPKFKETTGTELVPVNRVSQRVKKPTEKMIPQRPPQHNEFLNMSTLTCLTCNLSFSSKKTLLYHFQMRHSNLRKFFPCPLCTNIFFYFWGLTRHMMKIHKKSKIQIDKMRLKLRNCSFTKNITNVCNHAKQQVQFVEENDETSGDPANEVAQSSTRNTLKDAPFSSRNSNKMDLKNSTGSGQTVVRRISESPKRGNQNRSKGATVKNEHGRKSDSPKSLSDEEINPKSKERALEELHKKLTEAASIPHVPRSSSKERIQPEQIETNYTQVQSKMATESIPSKSLISRPGLSARAGFPYYDIGRGVERRQIQIGTTPSKEEDLEDPCLGEKSVQSVEPLSTVGPHKEAISDKKVVEAGALIMKPSSTAISADHEITSIPCDDTQKSTSTSVCVKYCSEGAAIEDNSIICSENKLQEKCSPIRNSTESLSIGEPIVMSKKSSPVDRKDAPDTRMNLFLSPPGSKPLIKHSRIKKTNEFVVRCIPQTASKLNNLGVDKSKFEMLNTRDSKVVADNGMKACERTPNVGLVSYEHECECGRDFISKAGLLSHKRHCAFHNTYNEDKRVEPNHTVSLGTLVAEKLFTCVCDSKFPSRDELFRHQSRCNVKEMASTSTVTAVDDETCFDCVCGRNCLSKAGLVSHQRHCEHTGLADADIENLTEDPSKTDVVFFYSCPCGRKFATKNGLVTHKRFCTMCEQSFSAPNTPITPNKFTCDCGYACDVHVDLTNHILSCSFTSASESEATCECGRTFINRSGLSSHKRYCTYDYVFCECGKNCTTKSGLSSHKRYCPIAPAEKPKIQATVVKPRIYVCPCGRKFNFKIGLKNHQRYCNQVVVNEKDKNVIENPKTPSVASKVVLDDMVTCEKCGRMFGRRASYVNHERTCNEFSKNVIRTPDQISPKKMMGSPEIGSGVRRKGIARKLLRTPNAIVEEPNNENWISKGTNAQPDGDSTTNVGSSRSGEKIKSNRKYVVGAEDSKRLHCQDTKKLCDIVNEVDLICMACKQEFTSISNLRRHAIRHLGWKRYKCKLCRFTSYNKSECNTHILRTHSEKIRSSASTDQFIVDLNKEASRVRTLKKKETLNRQKAAEMDESSSKANRSTNAHIPPNAPKDEIRRPPSVTKFNISTRNSPRTFDTSPYKSSDSEASLSSKHSNSPKKAIKNLSIYSIENGEDKNVKDITSNAENLPDLQYSQLLESKDLVLCDTVIEVSTESLLPNHFADVSDSESIQSCTEPRKHKRTASVDHSEAGYFSDGCLEKRKATAKGSRKNPEELGQKRRKLSMNSSAEASSIVRPAPMRPMMSIQDMFELIKPKVKQERKSVGDIPNKLPVRVVNRSEPQARRVSIEGTIVTRKQSVSATPTEPPLPGKSTDDPPT